MKIQHCMNLVGALTRWNLPGSLQVRLGCIILVAVFASSAVAQVEVGRSNIGSCTPLLATIKPRWSDVKRHMLPIGSDISRPESEHFVCISPSVTRTATASRVQTNADLKFYSSPYSRGLGIVCDGRLSACTQLNPGLFPDLEPKKKQKTYEPPKSEWVRPPSDGDQWNSN